MNRKLLMLLIALLLTLCFVFASCGGDGGDESSSSEVSESESTPDEESEEESEEDEEPDVYTVKFKLVYVGAPKFEARDVEDGARVGKLPEPTRKGYIFEGWYAEEDTEFEEKFASTTRIYDDVTLVAKWTQEPPCEHESGYSVALVTEATCTEPSVLIEKCRICSDLKETELEPALGHKIKTEEPVEATCKAEGYTLKHCTRKGCKFEEKVDVVPKLVGDDAHKYSLKWIVVKEKTDYAFGQEKRACIVCGNLELRDVEPNKYAEYATLPIKQIIVDNKVYVGIAGNASASATSLYRTTTAANAIDGSPTSFWRADTLVTSNNFTGDAFTLTLAKKFDIAAIEFTLPNYWAWKLGDECTVEFDVEILVDDQWVKVGTVSDADIEDEKSKNATVQLMLDKVYTTDKIRATVTHATRYAPAMIYEIQVYGYVEEYMRAPQSIAAIASGKITGSYNAWVNSSHSNLIDGSTQTSWCTDARMWRDESLLFYGRNADVTYWAEDYGEENKQTISKVVVEATEYTGETIRVVACRSYLKNQEVDKKDPTTGEVMKDADGNTIKETIQVQTYDWIDFGTLTVGTGGGTYEFIPTTKDADGVESATTLTDIIAVRVEVDNYGPDEVKDKPTVTKVTITTGEGETTHTELNWKERYKVYADFEFPQEQYIAYIDIVCAKDVGRIMSLQFWVEDSSYENGGYWVEDRKIEVFENSSLGGIATFTIDIGEYHKKIRLEITKEPAIWGAYIYDIIPYTIAEVPVGLPKNPNCLHKYTSVDPLEVVEATCMAPGYSVFKCFSCDLTWKTDATDMIDHTWDKGTEATAFNCKYKTYNCTVDGCSSTMKEIVSFAVDGSTYIEAPKVTKYYHDAPAAWTMTFDDGNYISTYEWLIPELQKRNLKVTAVLTDQFSNSYLPQWRSYIASGVFDIGSHSLNHGGGFADAVVDENTLMKEIDEAHYRFMSYFPGQRILGFATPNGSTSDGCANYVNDLMLGGRSGGQAGSFGDPDKLVTREQWGNLPSYVAYKVTTKENYKAVIDALVDPKSGDYGKWTAECQHTVADENGNGDQFAAQRDVMQYKFDYLIEKGLWVPSYTEALSYFRESHDVVIYDMKATSTSISLELTDGLSDMMLIQPLTFKMNLPSGWTNVTVAQNGKAIPVVEAKDYNPNMAVEMACTIKDGVLYFDAVPDAGTVVITKAN